MNAMTIGITVDDIFAGHNLPAPAGMNRPATPARSVTPPRQSSSGNLFQGRCQSTKLAAPLPGGYAGIIASPRAPASPLSGGAPVPGIPAVTTSPTRGRGRGRGRGTGLGARGVPPRP